MKFEFIASKQVAFPVSAMCRVLGVSPSGTMHSASDLRPLEGRRTRGSRPKSVSRTSAVTASTEVLACIRSCAHTASA